MFPQLVLPWLKSMLFHALEVYSLVCRRAGRLRNGARQFVEYVL